MAIKPKTFSKNDRARILNAEFWGERELEALCFGIPPLAYSDLSESDHEREQMRKAIAHGIESGELRAEPTGAGNAIYGGRWRIERVSAVRWAIGRCPKFPEWLAVHTRPEIYAQQEAEKKAAGRYTLREAAEEIERNTGERLRPMLAKLKAAVSAGALAVYEPGRNARYTPKTVHDCYEEAHAADLNAWLAKNESRIAWRFPEPDATVPDELRALARGTTAGQAHQRVLISELARALATAATDANLELWATGDNDELGRDIAIELNKLRCEWPTVPSVISHIRMMLERGDITARSVANNWPATNVESVIEYPSEYWLTREDADKVRALPQTALTAEASVMEMRTAPQPSKAGMNAADGSGIPAGTIHRLRTRDTPLSDEIAEAKRRASNSDNARSVWVELQKMAEKKYGALLGVSNDGIQYRGRDFESTGTPDALTLKQLRDRLGAAKRRAANNSKATKRDIRRGETT